MKQRPCGIHGLMEMCIVSAGIGICIGSVHILRQEGFKIFIELSAGQGKVRGYPDIPAEHLFQHIPHQGVVRGHGKGELVPGDAFFHITQTPEKFLAAPLKLCLGGPFDVKIFVSGRWQIGQTADLIQKREEELVAPGATFHGFPCLHTHVDAASIGKEQQPGVAILIVSLDAEAFAIAKGVILLLFKDNRAKLLQPGGVCTKALRFRDHIHQVKVLIDILWHVWVGAGAL